MTYLVGFIVIGVKGLFHSDWLGAGPAASPIGPQLGEGETGKSGTTSSIICKAFLCTLHYIYCT
jgi:hypothetical protein